MPSLTIYVVLVLFALLVLQKLLVARSDPMEPLTVRVITPKRSSAVAPAMVEPLRAPAPDVSPLVARAQQLSISDPTADVDDLLSSLSSFSMKAPLLKSCLKRDHSMPRHRRVHFQTQTISEVHLIETISPGKLQTLRSGNVSHNLLPHIPGKRLYTSLPNGKCYLVKSDGVFNSPSPLHTHRLRCGAIRSHGKCESCITPRQINVLVRDRVDICSVRAPRNWPANLPFYT
ncbi:hypothetical protein N431DRAFT_322183 [Stipitochalara longipes BDJ]|nr:hypothetical protein N431DRAFT_322183 [Stipitochalara longipes BDJ]